MEILGSIGLVITGLAIGAIAGVVFGAKWKQEAHDEEVKVRDELIAARDKVIAAFHEHLDKPVAAAPALSEAQANADVGHTGSAADQEEKPVA